MTPMHRSASDAHLMPRNQRARVLIADHDGLARRMLHTALQETDGIEMIPAVGNAREALELVRYYRPTVLIADTGLPPDGCVELIRKVGQIVPETRVLTVSVGDDETALAALRAGAAGHIGKDVDPGELGRLVALAADGEAIVPRRLVRPLLGLLREVPETGWRPVHSRLTTREWQIVELLGEDPSTDRIAECLVLCPATVYSHIKNVLRKLGVHSRRDAVAAAERLRQDEALGIKIPIPIG
jgi:DNA-binding NarL/FixJ family response regulator